MPYAPPVPALYTNKCSPWSMLWAMGACVCEVIQSRTWSRMGRHKPQAQATSTSRPNQRLPLRNSEQGPSLLLLVSALLPPLAAIAVVFLVTLLLLK
jgi:hypothetical protein